jgi:hypothetical protein
MQNGDAEMLSIRQQLVKIKRSELIYDYYWVPIRYSVVAIVVG